MWGPDWCTPTWKVWLRWFRYDEHQFRARSATPKRHHHWTSSSPNYSHYMTRINLSSDNTCPIDSRGRASPPGEASSGEFLMMIKWWWSNFSQVANRLWGEKTSTGAKCLGELSKWRNVLLPRKFHDSFPGTKVLESESSCYVWEKYYTSHKHNKTSPTSPKQINK